MKVAVINTFDARDVNIWAGTSKHICQFLEKKFGNDIDFVQLESSKRSKLSLIKGFYFNKIRKKKYYVWADINEIKNRERKYKLKNNYDLIITFEFHLVSFLKNENNKVIYWNDATFNNLIDFYSGYSNISQYCLTNGNTIQKKAFEKADTIIFSSDWAIDSALNYYKTEAKKIRKIFFASNLSKAPVENEIDIIIKLRSQKSLTLLFIGVDWDRKGGDDAVKVINQLNQNGISATLIVVGTPVPDQYKHNDKIVSLGFISKNSAEGENKIMSLLKEATFFILPTRADCTPVVFSEANSYGLPVITTSLGGIPSVIENNVNGCQIQLTNFTEKAVEFICNNLPSSDNYQRLCCNSFHFYNDKISWEQVQEKFTRIMSELNIHD